MEKTAWMQVHEQCRLSFLSHAILHFFFLLGREQTVLGASMHLFNKPPVTKPPVSLTRLGFSRWTKKDNFVKNNFCLVLKSKARKKK